MSSEDEDTDEETIDSYLASSDMEKRARALVRKFFTFKFVVGCVVGAVLGNLVYVLFVASEAKQRWSDLIFGLIGSVLTAVVMGFLFERHIRKRERRADKAIADGCAEITTICETLCEAMKQIDREMVPRTAGYRWALEYAGTGRSLRGRFTYGEIPELLFRLRYVPAGVNRVLSDFESIKAIRSDITALLAIANPRLASCVSDLFWDFDFGRRGYELTLGDARRQFETMERIIRFGRDTKDVGTEIDDMLDEICEGVRSMLKDVPDLLADFARDIEAARERWPEHAIKTYDETLKGLTEQADEGEEK
ncbi:MAG: QueT transporter family protein [Planctomycetes bacterium]|nr:QueT transporter family protein [Planctomycetota bacterium]